MEIVQKIKSLRKELKLTQKTLADKLLIDQAIVSNWERGKSEPTLRQHKALAKIAGVTPCMWMFDEQAENTIIKNVSLDEVKLKQSIQILENGLKTNNSTMLSDKKADAIILIYQILTDAENEAEAKNNVDRVLSLVT